MFLGGENLEARALAVASMSEEERKRARLSDRAVVSLTCSTPPYNRSGSHRVVTASSNYRWCASLSYFLQGRDFSISERKIRFCGRGKWPTDDSSITDWKTCDRANGRLRKLGKSRWGFGLRSARGKSGVKGEEQGIGNRSRSATPVAEPLTEVPPLLRPEGDCRSWRARWQRSGTGAVERGDTHSRRSAGGSRNRRHGDQGRGEARWSYSELSESAASTPPWTIKRPGILGKLWSTSYRSTRYAAFGIRAIVPSSTEWFHQFQRNHCFFIFGTRHYLRIDLSVFRSWRS